MRNEQIGLACWGLRETLLEDQLALCKALGAHRLELGIANGRTDLPLDTDADGVARVRAMFAAADVRLECAATGCDFTQADVGAVRADVRKVCRALELCQKIGIESLRIFAGFSAAHEVRGARWEVLCDALREVAAFAQQCGVTPTIELHGGVESFPDGVRHFHSVTTDPDLLRALLAILPQNVQFLLDPANLWAVGIEDAVPYYTLLRGRIFCIHAKDFALLPSGHLRPSACGTAAPNWPAFFESVADYRGPVLIEYELAEDVERGMRESLRYLRSLCSE